VGRQVGANLFHSFSQFNIQTGESATFTGPERHPPTLLPRSPAGKPPRSTAPLRSEMPNAALYLLNPAGVMFGPTPRSMCRAPSM